MLKPKIDDRIIPANLVNEVIEHYHNDKNVWCAFSCS